MKKILGKIIYNISRLLDLTLGFLIDILETVLSVMKTLGRAFLGLIAFIFFFTMMFMFGGLLGILLIPTALKLFLIFIVIPFFLEYIVEGLKLVKYGLTEYLYDVSNSLIDNKKKRLQGFISYFEEYINIKRERKRRAEEERIRYEQARRQAQEEAWRRFFEQATGAGGFNTNTGYGNNTGVFDIGFKEKYEASCDILGVNYNASKDDIRKAYRSLAKKYHPDLNKSEDATEKFQEINMAHDFLNEENIMKYRNLK